MEQKTNTSSMHSETGNTRIAMELTAEEKNIAVISYITIIGLIIAFVMNGEKKAAFSTYHIKQSLGLGLTGLALGIIGMVPILGWIVSFFGVLVLLYLWIMGLVNAINGKQIPVPLLGKKYEELFKNL